MISEPEMVGDFGPPEVSGTADPPEAVERAARRWLWALGGAVAASALWAGGLYALDTYGGSQASEYRLRPGVCDGIALKALSTAVGPASQSSPPTLNAHSAVDRATCTYQLATPGKPAKPAKPPQGEPEFAYEAWLSLDLFKKSDPGPVFEADREMRRREDVAGKVEAVPGLGDQAYLVIPEGGNAPELHVQQGGFVVVLGLYSTSLTDHPVDDSEASVAEPPPDPDLSGLRPAMVEDVRDVMRTLKNEARTES